MKQTRYFKFLFMVFALASLGISSLSSRANAQEDIAWVQVEALPSLANAQTRIRAYAGRLPDVNGFALGGGWYGVALGPYTRNDATRVLQVYRAEGEIPNDSFVAFSSSFRQQFWPVGANLLNLPAAQPAAPQVSEATPAQPEPTETTQVAIAAPEPQAEPMIQPAEETLRQARSGEAALSREARKELQVALKWAGFYTSTIDGAFGRGTRNSMAKWQEANAYEKTGVLTTAQRAALFDQYNAVLKGLGLEMVQEQSAGIEILMPTKIVKFQKYEPPFVHYSPTGDIDARLLLISQAGDQSTLFGLYDIMQTLEIVPQDGPRERNKNSFTLIGEGAQFISHTEARLEGGKIKGFTLIWPAGDEERRTRLLGEMQKSFASLDGALDAGAGSNEEQRIDLVAGLEIRKPKLARSGFFADTSGTVVTTAEAVASCGRITIEGEHDAVVLAVDDALGVAVIRAKDTLAPLSIASFQSAVPRLQSEISVAGYSYEGILGAPTLTYGKLADLRGLRGEEELKRLALSALPGDAGGPVFDAGGAVLGMLLPEAQGDKKLPDGVSFAADAAAIRKMLDQAGVAANGTDKLAQMAPEDLIHVAGGMTVLVSCWE